MSLPDYQSFRYQSLQNRAKKIVSNKDITSTWTEIATLRKQRCAPEVFKSLNGQSPSQLTEMFEVMQHKYDTRGNKQLLRLPKVKSETGRKTFQFIGAKVFNILPNSLKTEKSLVLFGKNIKAFNSF